MAKKEIKNNKNKTTFMKSFKAELKKVIWPTPKQLLNSTVAVLVIVIITALIVFVLDFTFEFMNKQGIDKVKQIVSNSTNTEVTDTENQVSGDEGQEANNSADTTDESNAVENTNNE